MKNRINKIIAVAGAIIAFVIGSGFATGQELIQFYVSNGVIGCIGSLIISGTLLAWVCSIMMEDGYRLQLNTANSIWRYYCGPIVGKIIELFNIAFQFMLLVMMTAGAGASLQQYAGIDPVIGRAILAAMMLLTVMLGMKRLTKILGGIGIALMILGILVAVVGIVRNADSLQFADEVLSTKVMAKASPYWWLSGLLYPAFTIICLAPFTSGVSRELPSDKDAKVGGLLGIGGIMAISALVCVALMATAQFTAEADVPTLVMAKSINDTFGFLYCIVLILGIFSTAVSLLWLFCNSVFGDENSLKFKLLAVLSSICSFFGSVMPFKTIVNIILPYTGYLGLVVIACVLFKHYSKKAE